MPAQIAFWVILLLWLCLGAAPLFRGGDRSLLTIGGALLPFCAIALLGWHVFGPALTN